MAADHDLKRLDGDLETDVASLFPPREPGDGELEAYRGRLGVTLERATNRRRARRRVGILLAAAAALTVVVLRLQVATPGSFDQRSLEEVQIFVAQSDDRSSLSAHAARALVDGFHCRPVQPLAPDQLARRKCHRSRGAQPGSVSDLRDDPGGGRSPDHPRVHRGSDIG